MRSRMILYLVIVIAIFMASGCGSDYPATGAPTRAEREAATPRLVHVIPAAQDRVARGTVVTGTLAAEDQVVLSFKVNGRLSEISVDLGSRVRKGQIIAQLDLTDFRLRVRQAEAALQQARARLGLSPRWYG